MRVVIEDSYSLVQCVTLDEKDFQKNGDKKVAHFSLNLRKKEVGCKKQNLSSFAVGVEVVV
jgi:hypothetical protein